MLVAVAIAGMDGLGSVVLVMIVNVKFAASGLEPRASVIRDGCLSSLDLPIFLKMCFILSCGARYAARKVGLNTIDPALFLQHMIFGHHQK